MTEDKYINRLIDWIAAQGSGTTLRDVITSDLQDLGKRIDAFHDAGHKGAHAEVSQYEASRFIAGTYLLVGDILRLWTGTDELTDADGEATGEEPSVVDGSSVTSEDK